MGISCLIYFIGITENINSVLMLTLLALFVVAVMMCTPLIFDEHAENTNTIATRKNLKILGIIIVILSLVKISIPSKEYLASMIAVPYLLENTNAKELPNETVDAILRLLKNNTEENNNKKSN